jgi:hypothetical protein
MKSTGFEILSLAANVLMKLADICGARVTQQVTKFGESI